MLRSRPTCLLAVLLLVLSTGFGCVNHPPTGMAGTDTLHSAEVEYDVATLQTATEAALRERLDTWDLDGDGTTEATFRTGRARIEIRALDEGGSSLRVFLQELTGRDHADKARQLWTRITELAAGG